MKYKFNLLIVLFLGLLFLFACSRSYSGFFFSYPADSKPHENNWTYLGKIIAWDPFLKKPTDKGIRKIQIIVQDKEKNVVLEDKLEFNCAPISREIIWSTLEKLNIKIYERGNPFAEDEYNKRLIKEGPRLLISLLYIWDGEKYIKEGTEQINSVGAKNRAVD